MGQHPFSDLGNRRPVFDLKANNIKGFPDGMTIDANGNLWLALFSGSMVRLMLFIQLSYSTKFNIICSV
jgi:sugar lactone lactonase YvrE